MSFLSEVGDIVFNYVFGMDNQDYLNFATQTAEHRSLTETMIFRGIEGVLLIVRFFAIIYFCMQAYTHSRYQGEK
jgi:hypothetical protein